MATHTRSSVPNLKRVADEDSLKPEAKRHKPENGLISTSVLEKLPVSSNTGESRISNGGSPEEEKKQDATDVARIPVHGMEEASPERWRAHSMLQDYVEVVGNLMNPGVSYYHESIERLSGIGYFTAPFRRRAVWEDWSPFEISVFSAGIAQFGKDFYEIQKRLPNKSTKDVVAFYYVWKKTTEYSQWKKEYIHDGVLEDETEERFHSIPRNKKKRKTR